MTPFSVLGRTICDGGSSRSFPVVDSPDRSPFVHRDAILHARSPHSAAVLDAGGQRPLAIEHPHSPNCDRLC
jgi:hypothetical protein